MQAWDRYAYVNNNPVRHQDPTGHSVPVPENPWDDLYIPVSDGWDLVAAAACFVACDFLPVHYESYGPGQGAIVGDSLQQSADKSILGLAGTVNLETDIYRFGGSPNGSGVRAPRFGDFDLPHDSSPDMVVGPGPEGGASTFSDPFTSGLSGHYYKISEGTQLPDGLGIVADGIDVVESSQWPPTHHTIYPTTQMTFAEFVDKILNLPWQYKGKIK